jgi:hypothetical protein
MSHEIIDRTSKYWTVLGVLGPISAHGGRPLPERLTTAPNLSGQNCGICQRHCMMLENEKAGTAGSCWTVLA